MGAMATKQQERVRDESRASVVLASARGDPRAAAVFARHEAARIRGKLAVLKAAGRLRRGTRLFRAAAGLRVVADEQDRAAVILDELADELGYAAA